MHDIRVRRVYDDPTDGDGQRILVDRLWPRGLRRADAALDQHATAAAPSDALRRWYGHVPERLEEFRQRYLAELDAPDAAGVLDDLLALARNGPITLLTAARDLQLSHAPILAEHLRARNDHTRNDHTRHNRTQDDHT